ncbi:ribosome 60S biogenesis N-terminal-domain-containing protein [Lactarius indigo]|nr:ribosome 60S biogenesis N-terminal-domain-containing protein [Lactarius indigo]
MGPHVNHSLPGPGPAKKRKHGPSSQRHWDDPEQQSSTLPYDEDDVENIKEDDDDDDMEEGEEESRELTHDEIWDDSALIAAWESATAEYEAYHGKGKEWKQEPVKRSPLWYNVPPDPSKLRKSALVPQDPPQTTQPDPENSHPLNFDTFVPSHDPSLAHAPQLGSEPNGISPVPGEHVSRDEAFNRALGAMYWAGYWTAMYHSHQRSNGEGVENDAVTNGYHESLGKAENAEDDDEDEELLVSTQSDFGVLDAVYQTAILGVVMPTKNARGDARSTKRVKLDAASSNPYRYSDGADIERRLQAQTDDDLLAALAALRNQLTIKAGEGPIQPQDERLALAHSWLEAFPGAQSVFAIWERTTERQMSLIALLVSVLSSLLTILSTQYTHHKLGQPILKTLLSPDYLFYLNSYLTGSHNELIIASLKLFSTMSAFGGGCEKRGVLEGFSWDNKGLHKLLSMRRRAKAGSVNVLVVPDIRTLYVLFILSFVDSSATSSLKSSFLEQRQDAFRSILAGLDQDPYSLARRILEVAWVGIWLDPKIKRTSKVNVFNEKSLYHITRLYDRSVGEGSDDQIPADLAHHFLLAICTHPGVGVCFKDRGWYPRETEEESKVTQSDNNETAPKNARIYNKILSHLLKSLKVNEDPRQQELALRIMSACPELVSGYWSSASLALEPRLSSKWIANIAFFGNVISLPVPEPSFFLAGGSLYQPTPPPLTAFIENVFPSVNTKAHFSRGLLLASPLVQHCTALALGKCLSKYSELLRVMRKVESVLEEDEHSGQWKKRRHELEREARRRVPDFQVVIAFSQKSGEHVDVQSTSSDVAAKSIAPNKVRAAMLAESSIRLLWLYHLCFPSVVAEARFDVGKTLQSSFGDVGTDSVVDPTSGLDTLRRLHVLRLLKESDQFLWTGKSGNRSYINILLSAYVSMGVATVRDVIGSLLRRLLSESILFEHDPEEVYFWLSSLPTAARSKCAGAPDGAPLLDEQAVVINLLDDCIQLCLKTPYGYIEEVTVLSRRSTANNDYQDGGNVPSPLLATIMEQVFAKVSGNLLRPLDVLVIVSFVRKLLVRLSGRQGSIMLLVPFSERLASLPFDDDLTEEHTTVRRAVAREISTLNELPPLTSRPNCDHIVTKKFVLFPTSNALCQSSALELIDCARPIDAPLWREAIMRLISTISRIRRLTVGELLRYLDPGQRLLQDPTFFNFTHTRKRIPFDWAFIQCGPEQLSEAEYRDSLTNAIFDDPQPLFEAKAALNVIGYRLLPQQAHSTIVSGVLLLIADIMQAGKSSLPIGDFVGLKEHLFGMVPISTLLTSSAINAEMTEKGIRPILISAVDQTDILDRILVSPFSSHWAIISASTSRFDNLAQITFWLPFMTHEEVLSVLDQALLDFDATMGNEGIKNLLQAVFSAIERHIDTDDVPGLRSRLPQFVSLYSAQPDWHLLESLITRAINSASPAWIDGVPHSVNASSALEPLVLTSCSRWSRRLTVESESLDVSMFLKLPEWTPQSVSPRISLLLYGLGSMRRAATTSDRAELWRKHLNKLAAGIINTSAPRHHRITYGRAIRTMFEKLPSLCSEFSLDLLACIKGMPKDTLTAEVLKLGRRLVGILPQEDDGFASTLLEHALSWVARSFAGSDALDTSLVKCFPSIKPHLTDAVLTALIQNRLSDKRALNFVLDLTSITQLKSTDISKASSSMLNFYKHTETTAAPRDAVVQLVHLLFLKYPTNTCQPSHVLPLSSIYGGTLLTSDRRLLNIFCLFEETKKMSAASLLTRAVSGAENALDAILSLDPVAVFRTCLVFPSWRKLDDLEHHLDVTHPLDARLYDPVFVTLLMAHVLDVQRPSSTVEWVRLFRTNAVSLLIRSLSSQNVLLRNTCVCQISAIVNALESADMQEKPHVFYILHMLKDTFKESPKESTSLRLPSFTTLLLSHALRGVFYPENFIYPLTARFLLQRPELDITDVPMLYAMLYSSSDDWKKERSWILKFIADAMLSAGEEEWKVLLNLTNSRRIVTSLVLKSGLLSWIETMLLVPQDGEVLSWMRALENILDVVDAAKMESSTGGEWRAAIGRCMSSLQGNTASPSFLAGLQLKSRIVAKLSLLPGPTIPAFDVLLSQCLVGLRHLEKNLILPEFSFSIRSPPRRRHTSYSSREEGTPEAHDLWGEAVVSLWRASTTSGGSQEAWDELTPRVLIWNMLVDGEDPSAEWARREVVRNMTTN